MDQKKDPTPHNEKPNSAGVIGRKNFFKIKSKRREVNSGILPIHRVIFENYRNNNFKSLSKAIRQTGVYSPTFEKQPWQLTKSKSWKLLMDEMMPEQHLALRHSELLDKREIRKVERLDENGQLVLDGEGKPIMDEVDNGPETAAVTKALEMAYKLRGSFQKDETPVTSTVMYNLFYKPEVREQMKAFEDGLKKTLFNEIDKRNLKEAEEEGNRNDFNEARLGEFEEVSEQRGGDVSGGTEQQ